MRRVSRKRFPVPDSLPVTERTRLTRDAQSNVYDRESIYKIFDEAFVCHLGFVQEGQPFVIPIRLVAHRPVRDARCDVTIPTPKYAAHYHR